MTEKELIIELMKIDKSLGDKGKKLSNILGTEGVRLRGTLDDNIKSIPYIIFDFVDIPKENLRPQLNNKDEDGLDNYFCRDGVFSLYYDGVFEGKIDLDNLAVLLIEIGKNNGEFTEKQIKFTKEELDWTWR